MMLFPPGAKVKGDFKIVTIYSEKGSRYVNLFNRDVNESVTEPVVNEALSKEQKMVETFLNTEFEGGRHQNRIDKIPLSC